MKNKKGVTLLEIMLGLVILGVVLCGMGSVLIFGKRVSFDYQDKLMAFALSQSLNDELMNNVVAHDQDNECLYNFTKCPKYTVTIDGKEYNLSVSNFVDVVGNAGPTTLRRGTITVSWAKRKWK